MDWMNVSYMLIGAVLSIAGLFSIGFIYLAKEAVKQLREKREEKQNDEA